MANSRVCKGSCHGYDGAPGTPAYITIAVGGDISLVGPVGLNGALGTYITTKGKHGGPDIGRYTSNGSGYGVDFDGSLGVTFVIGGVDKLEGGGTSTSFDAGVGSLDVNYTGDGQELTGFTLSVGTSFSKGASDTVTNTTVDSYFSEF